MINQKVDTTIKGKNIKIKHSFNAGDLIVILPGLRQLYRDTGRKIHIYQRLNLDAFYYHNQINSTINKEGNSVCMNKQLFSMLKPLIESQDYIQSFNEWQGEVVDLDYDLSRDSKSVPMPAGLIHTYTEAIFPQTSTNLSEKWVEVEPNYDYVDKIVINRTQRYTNPYVSFYFLKDHEKNIIFSGTEQEHSHFCEQWNLNLERVKVDDFLQLAKIIKGCRFGVYNQSLHWHLSDAMKTTRVLEVCALFPNTFATGANGYHSFGQQSLEFYFKKLIQ